MPRNLPPTGFGLRSVGPRPGGFIANTLWQNLVGGWAVRASSHSPNLRTNDGGPAPETYLFDPVNPQLVMSGGQMNVQWVRTKYGPSSYSQHVDSSSTTYVNFPYSRWTTREETILSVYMLIKQDDAITADDSLVTIWDAGATNYAASLCLRRPGGGNRTPGLKAWETGGTAQNFDCGLSLTADTWYHVFFYYNGNWTQEFLGSVYSEDGVLLNSQTRNHGGTGVLRAWEAQGPTKFSCLGVAPITLWWVGRTLTADEELMLVRDPWAPFRNEDEFAVWGAAPPPAEKRPIPRSLQQAVNRGAVW